MTEDLKRYEKTIKRVHSFKWTPRYEEAFHTELDVNTALAIAIIAFERLEWVLIFQNDNSVVAWRISKRDRETEKIGVAYDSGIVKIKSISTMDDFWNKGRNSKRVKLFIHAFQITEKELNKEDLVKLGEEYEQMLNWDNYEVPEELPNPKKRITPNIHIAIIVGIIVAAFFRYIIAWLNIEGFYSIGIEIFVVLVISWAFYCLIRLSNYINFDILKFVLLGVIIVAYIPGSYLEYKIVTDRYEQPSITYSNFDLIALIVGKLLQIGGTYYISSVILVRNIISYIRKRVPIEVVDFVYYHYLKDKDENEIRIELNKKGWKSEQCQDEVFEALDVMQLIGESNKIDVT